MKDLDITDILSLFTSIFIVDFIITTIARYKFGRPINSWYNLFGFSAVLSDVFSIAIGILIGYYVYTEFVKKENEEFCLNKFIFIAVIVQFLHDVLFYQFVIKPFPENQNDMMDVFKDYANNSGIVFGGADILIIDALMIIMSIKLFDLIHRKLNKFFKLLLFCVVLYAFQYILYTRNEFSITAPYIQTNKLK